MVTLETYLVDTIILRAGPESCDVVHKFNLKSMGDVCTDLKAIGSHGHSVASWSMQKFFWLQGLDSQLHAQL